MIVGVGGSGVVRAGDILYEGAFDIVHTHVSGFIYLARTPLRSPDPESSPCVARLHHRPVGRVLERRAEWPVAGQAGVVG